MTTQHTSEIPQTGRVFHPTPRENARLIIQAGANMLGHSVTDLTGPRRFAKVSAARHIIMHAIREMTEFSLPRIGQLFGDRDHTSVLYGIRRVSGSPDLASSSARLQQEIAKTHQANLA